MTPKEKAEDLVFKYDFLQAVIEGFSFYDAKQCALIAVDEILKVACDLDIDETVTKLYWQNVKQEIQKL